MLRRFLVPGLLFVCLAAVLGLAVGAGASSARAVPASASPAVVPCDFTPLSFSLTGVGPLPATRPFTPTTGDLLVQFVPLPPITATASSAGLVMVNESYSGTASGGITGTFAISNLNGIMLTAPEGVMLPRGIMVNEVVIHGAAGTITGLLGVNFISLTPQSPNNRTFSGYIHSTSTSGAYAPYRFQGLITGQIATQAGNIGLLNANVTGRLYTGGSSVFANISAYRPQPITRSTVFEPLDLIAQFTRPDLVATTPEGRMNPRNTFTGTLTGLINGGFVFDNSAVLLGTTPGTDRGWMVGNLNFLSTAGDVLTGPWLMDDLGSTFSGYVFQTLGTGVYSDSLLFGTVQGYFLPSGMLGTVDGVLCDAMQLITPTPGPSTPTPSIGATNTPTPVSTAPATTTAQPTAAQTATATATATATPTACLLNFADVPSDNTFYPFVRCLACQGIIQGYPCGGPSEPCNAYADPYFRPNNYVTRGQLAKIVSESAGFGEEVPPSQWTFTDVPYGSTFWLWVERLAGREVMVGYSCGGPNEPCDSQNRPYFRPGFGATRGQLTKIVSNAAGFDDAIPETQQTFADVPPTHTFWLFVERLLTNRPDVMGGYQCGGPGEPCDTENRPYFRPNNPLTRGQTSKIVANTFFPGCDPPRP